AMGRTQRMDLEFNFRFTAMFDLFPAWREVLAQPHDQKKRMMGDEEVRRRLREEWDARISRMSSRQPRFLQIARTALPKNRSLAGRKLVDLQRETGKHIVDLLLDVSLEEDLRTQFMYVGTMNGDEEAVAQIVTSPYSVPGVSDAGAHVDMDCGVDFSDVLLGKWVRQRGVLSLEQAVNRLTFFSASLLGLTDRGLIREGMAADVVVFDAETIGPAEREMVADLPGGGRRLVQRSDAVRTVIVNGQVLLEEGRHTGDLPGRIVSGGTRRANGA
ncbi:MAG: amidohydrolase family protein, partial [Chloroflexi bacterium]|nr:amidohydrolase family protein [Chloroflexota bacterium]